MPFVSKKQNAWAHTPSGTKALGGEAKVAEWDQSTDFSSLPERKKKFSYSPKKKKVERPA